MPTVIAELGAPCPWLSDQQNCECPCEGCRHHCAAHWSQFAWLDMGYRLPVRVDYEADMGYIEVSPYWPEPEQVITDLTHEDDCVIVDRSKDGRLLGIEVFLHKGHVRSESEVVIRKLLGGAR